MKYITATILVLSILFITSCEKSDKDFNEFFDCEFVQEDKNMDGLIDDHEKQLMEDCDATSYKFKADIEENLLGEWILVGHGEGWVAEISQPCGYLIIEEDELTFKFQDGFIDSTFVSSWQIKETPTPSFSDFQLEADPYIYALEITSFSEELMYGDATPLDGNMYMYKKVK